MKYGLAQFILLSAFLLTGCLDGETIDTIEELPTNHIIDRNESDADSDNNSNHSDEKNNPIIWLSEITEVDLEKNTQSCASHMKHELCVVICQIKAEKPINAEDPKQYRTLMMPVIHLVDHLNRGGVNIGKQDFLGRCSEGLELSSEDNDAINYCDGNLSSFDCL